MKLSTIFKKLQAKYRMFTKFTYVCLGQKITAPPKHKTYLYMEQFKNHDVKLAVFAKLICNKYNDTTIIDIGANIGDTLSIIKSSNPETNVLCIEGNEYFYNYLLENAKNYKNTCCLNILISDKTGEINVEQHKYVGSTNFKEVINDGERIKTQTLMEVIKEQNIIHCKLIKSDTDGFDFKILLSSINLISIFKPILFFEYDVNWNNEDPIDSLTLIKNLSELGYYFVIYDNYGNYMNLVTTDAIKYFGSMNVHILQSRKYGGGFCYTDILAIHQSDQDILDGVLSYEHNQIMSK